MASARLKAGRRSTSRFFLCRRCSFQVVIGHGSESHHAITLTEALPSQSAQSEARWSYLTHPVVLSAIVKFQET